MLQTLKRKLIHICGLSTTIIITCITLIALSFSEKQLNTRRQLVMQNNLLNVIEHLQKQMLSYSWLSQVEVNNETIIHIYTDSTKLSFPGSYLIGEEREQLLNKASASLYRNYSLNELPVTFDFSQNKKHYLALYTSTTYKNTVYHILLIQDLKNNDDQILMMRIFFGMLIVFGSILLSLFSFWFVSKAVKPIEISQKEQNDFISAASHEMRSPLAVIRASTDNLLEDHAFEENKYIHAISKECSQLTRFVNDLLFLANTDCGHWQVNPTPIEMDTLLLEAYDTFLPLVNQKAHELDIELPEEKQPSIMVDAERITQTLSILINNALAYTPEHCKITLSLMNTKDMVTIGVSDNGPGISDEAKKLIFNRFYRADSARHDSEHYGLGLSIATEIIKQHQGKLTVSDTPGGGTTFNISLPITT